VLRATQFAGFLGAGPAGAADVPQISHLIRAHCSAGLTVFVVLGVIQLAATALILFSSTRYAHSYCAIHLPHILVSERESVT
jgi:hypothetical protein